MNAEGLIHVAGRDRRLALSLRAIAVCEWVLMGALIWHWTAAGYSLVSAVAMAIIVWLAGRLFVPMGSYVFKLALGDWPASVRGSPLQALRVLARESYWMLRVYALEHPWRRGALQYRAGSAKPPLVLVHGFLCNAAIWGPLLASGALTDRTVVALSLEPTYRRFVAQLKALQDCVDQVLAQAPSTQVVLVGHSMGGLLARAFAAEFPDKVAGIVCVAAPHHGTWFGSLVYGSENGPPNARARWLLAFNARTQERIAPPALNLWTDQDSIVIPARGSQLAHTPEGKLAGLGHIAAVASPAGITAIVQAIHTIDR